MPSSTASFHWNLNEALPAELEDTDQVADVPQSSNSNSADQSSTLPQNVTNLEPTNPEREGYIRPELKQEYVPVVGMTFSNFEAAFDFYKRYGYHSGFRVAKKGETSKDPKKFRQIIRCSREGKPEKLSTKLVRERRRIVTKCYCKAMVEAVPVVATDKDGKWFFKQVLLEHNHDLIPESSYLFPCYRSLPLVVQRHIEIYDNASISVKQTVNAIMAMGGGSAETYGYIEKDIRNRLYAKRKLNLKKGDARGLMCYLQQKKSEDKRFFYKCEFDDENCLEMTFWADSRAIDSYRYFGDVFSFDVTYITNRYGMPFTPIVRVNHHMQSILFGAALVSYETTESYEWVFKTLMECLDNKAPNCILTDQCIAIAKAIKSVMPATKHRLCIWHILNKVSHKVPTNMDLQHEVGEVVRESYTPEQFEADWEKMIKEHDAEEHVWLGCMFDIRARSVPAFLNDHFWAAMQSTQRSESINSYSDGFVNPKSGITQFVQQYQIADSKLLRYEKEEDFRCKKGKPHPIFNTRIERQFCDEYTINVFTKFQNELVKVAVLRLNFKITSPNDKTYFIQEENKRRPCLVYFNRDTQTIKCQCSMFETAGILCQHCLLIFREENIDLAPPKYILERWSKNFKRIFLHKQPADVVTLSKKADRTKFYENLHPVFLDLVEYCTLGDGNYKKISNNMTALRAEIALGYHPAPNQACSSSANQDEFSEVNDPKMKPAKRGRPKKQVRFMSNRDRATKNLRDKYKKAKIEKKNAQVKSPKDL